MRCGAVRRIDLPASSDWSFIARSARMPDEHAARSVVLRRPREGRPHHLRNFWKDVVPAAPASRPPECFDLVRLVSLPPNPWRANVPGPGLVARDQIARVVQASAKWREARHDEGQGKDLRTKVKCGIRLRSRTAAWLRLLPVHASFRQTERPRRAVDLFQPVRSDRIPAGRRLTGSICHRRCRSRDAAAPRHALPGGPGRAPPAPAASG